MKAANRGVIAFAAFAALAAASTAAVASGTSSGSGAPSCKYAFYDPSSDAPDGFTGTQDDQLDLVQGSLGLTADGSKLRVVLNIKNLTKTIPTPSNYLDYEFFWTNPSGDTGPNAVDVQVDNSGQVTYTDGTESVTSAGDQFTASPTSAATGSFGSGPNGTIEVDVPLSELKLSAGSVLTKPSAYSAEGAKPPAGPSVGSIVDQDGPGNDYKLGEPTCVNPNGPSGSSGSSGGNAGSGGSNSGATKPTKSSHHRRHRAGKHPHKHKRHHKR
jgi:hypothetical protein